jgi:glycosyltransferase involved in cell wall biosynthesis
VIDQDRRPAVCIVRQSYYPDGHVRRDAETLVQEGYDVSLVALRRKGQLARETLNGVQVYRLPVEHIRGGVLRYAWEYASFFALAFLQVTWLHLRKRFGVVEVDNLPDVLVFTALVPKLTGARVILYAFDHMPELLQVIRGVSASHPVVRLLAFLAWVSGMFADRVIVTGEPARDVVRDRGVPDGKITTVLNCPNETVFDHRRPRPFGRRRGSLEIVTHGVVLPRFGIHVLIEAMPAILAEAPEARLQVYGEGEQRPELEALARQLGVADRVRFHGLVPFEEVPDRLRSADVGYVGMLCDLMISNKLMEYVALRVPVVISRWPTYEYYFPDDAVTYYGPGDAPGAARAILAVYRDPEGAQVKAERALELYLTYRWTVQREVYLSVFADLLGAANAPGPSRRSRPEHSPAGTA